MKYIYFFILFPVGFIAAAQSPPHYTIECSTNHKFEQFHYNDFSFYPDQVVGTFQDLRYKGVNIFFAGSPVIEMAHNQHILVINPRGDDDSYKYLYAGEVSDSGNVELCDALSQFFFVEQQQIDRYIKEYAENPSSVNETDFPDIFRWPARNNPHFRKFNFYEVDLSPDVSYAPFVDVNGDGNYDPKSGDYPQITGKGMSWNIRTIEPYDENFPSVTFMSSYVVPFADDEDSKVSTTFYYRSSMRVNGEIDSLRLGLYLDPDLCCPFDDYYGSKPDEGLFLINNVDSLDGQDIDGEDGTTCGTGEPTFLDEPPILVIKNMRALSISNKLPHENVFYASGEICQWDKMQLALRGEACYGQPYRLDEDDACDTPFDVVTRHSYHGNPADTSSACFINGKNTVMRDMSFMVAYDKIINITADKTYEFVLGLSVIETEYKKRVDFNDTTIINRVNMMTELYEQFPTSTIDVTPKSTSQLYVFPNPSSNQIYVNAELRSDITIYDTSGRKVLFLSNFSGSVIDISSLETGLYFIVEKSLSGVRNGKFVKN